MTQESILDNYTCINDDNVKTYISDLSILNYINLINNEVHYINKEFCTTIYNSFKKAYKEGELKFPGTLTVCNYENDLYLIDGYHRHWAIKKLWKNNDNENDMCTIKIDVIPVTSYNDIIEEYKLIHTTQYCYINETIEQSTNEIIKIMKDTYKSGKNSIIKTKSVRPRIPFISENDLVDSINDTKFLKLLDVEKIKNLIDQVNKKYEKEFNADNYDLKIQDSTNEFGCFLGTDPGLNWVKIIDNDARRIIFG